MNQFQTTAKKRGLLYGRGGGDGTSSKRQQTAWPFVRWRGWGWNQFQTTAKSKAFFTMKEVGMKPVPNDSKKQGLLYGGGGAWGWNQFQTTAKNVAFFTVEGLGMEPVPNDSKQRGLLYGGGGGD